MDPIRLSAFPFDSQIVGYSSDGLPEYDRASNSKEFAGLLKGFFRDGVFSGNALQVLANGGMTATVGTGGVIVQGRVKHLTTNHLVEFDTASNQPRLDRVVIRRDLSNSVRDLVIDVLKGAPATTPAAPALTRNETVWEICLATVKITANATVVQQSNITDTRLDSNLCGIVAAVLSDFDTTTFYEQIQADLDGFKAEEQAEFVEWFESLKDILDENVAANLQNQINDRVAITVQDFSAEEKSIARQNIDALATSDTAVDASKLGGKFPEYYIILENLLDNSDFTDPVYQEGLGGLHGTITYALDRWIFNNTADKLSLNSGAGLSFGVGNVIYQRLGRCDVTDGSDYTIAIWTSDGHVHCTKLTAGYTTVGGSGYSATHGSENCVYINNSGDGLPIKYVGLFRCVYTADQLQYVSKGYTAELMECQRIYNRVKGTMGYGVMVGTSCIVEVPLPTTMRGEVNPTVVINSGTAWAYYHAGYLALTYTSALHTSNGVKLFFSCSETAPCSCVVPDLDISVSEDL